METLTVSATDPAAGPGPQARGFAGSSRQITVTKHHGLGNDFLIALEPKRALEATDAIAWCDRRRGIGADGLIMAECLAEDLWSMTLWNSDGSRPEVSGNGLRCLGQALAMNLGISDRHSFTVRTDGGTRSVEVEPDRRSGMARVRVDMGPANDSPPVFGGWADLGVAVERQLGVDIGNPHVVALVDDASSYDPRIVGPQVESSYSGGINVHLIDIQDRDTIRLVVWERGAGYTEACGSGACAAAWAAHRWGLVDAAVNVVMPGGSALVEIASADLGSETTATPTDTVYLTGPAAYVGTVLLNA